MRNLGITPKNQRELHHARSASNSCWLTDHPMMRAGLIQLIDKQSDSVCARPKCGGSVCKLCVQPDLILDITMPAGRLSSSRTRWRRN